MQFCACVAWYAIAHAVAASTASGFALRFDVPDEQPLFEAIALLFLVVLGISALRARERRRGPLQWSLGLSRRATFRQEWGMGAAMGWGVAVVSVLGMLLARALHLQLWNAPRAYALLALSAASLVVATLAKVLALYGYGYQHLVEAIGPTRATLMVMAVVTADAILTQSPSGTPDGARVLVSIFGALLLCLCWLRTRAVWMGWGAWFGWAASTALLFGLPLGTNYSYSAVVDGRTVGHQWLTGGDYGPSAAGFVVLLLLAAIPVLMRVTDEFAWKYGRREIVSGGIPMDIPAPAAHAAMEEKAPPVPALVQIQPLAPVQNAGDAASD